MSSREDACDEWAEPEGSDVTPVPRLDLLTVPSAVDPASDTDTEKDDVNTALMTSSGTSGWAALRSTVRVAGAMRNQRKQVRAKAQGVTRADSFMKKFSTRYGTTEHNSTHALPSAHAHANHANAERGKTSAQTMPSRQVQFEPIEQPKPAVINPDGNFMFYWLGVVTFAVLYNLWTCIAREGFPDLRDGLDLYWFVADGLCDCVYVLDVFIQLRTGYLERGLVVYSSQKLALHYTRSKYFVIDLLALLPLDLLQLAVGIHPILRFPRFLKAYRAYRFSYMVETRTVYPNMWRVANLSHVLFLGSHWFAAFYYMISEAEGFQGTWGYPQPVGEFASVTRKYLKCLYWSTLTLTTIGDLPPPDSNWQ